MKTGYIILAAYFGAQPFLGMLIGFFIRAGRGAPDEPAGMPSHTAPGLTLAVDNTRPRLEHEKHQAQPGYGLLNRPRTEAARLRAARGYLREVTP